jgi:hypothetical protein
MCATPNIMHRISNVALFGLVLLGLFGCGKEGDRPALLGPGVTAGGAARDPSETRIALPFDSTNFVGGVQNPYFPLVPGTIWTYRQETPEGVETNTVEVTHDTKVILGVTTFVVHDQVFLEGSLKEDTFDWYAPDKDGNVWYFGEDTRELGPPVSTAGSWEAGKDGAQAGIIMLAHPEVGDTYYQENAPGVVADQARVKGLNETATTPFDTFTGCIKTQEWTPLEPGNRAFKFYASGVGTVLEVPNQGGDSVELTAFTTPAP